jgi:hypothetical protein
MSARFSGLLAVGYRGGSRVNAADTALSVGQKRKPPDAEPGVNAGPNTGFAGKGRERPSCVEPSVYITEAAGKPA